MYITQLGHGYIKKLHFLVARLIYTLVYYPSHTYGKYHRNVENPAIYHTIFQI